MSAVDPVPFTSNRMSLVLAWCVAVAPPAATSSISRGCLLFINSISNLLLGSLVRVLPKAS